MLQIQRLYEFHYLGRIARITQIKPIVTDVTRSVVCVSVCVLATRMYCVKTAEPIEISFSGRLM